MRFAHLSDLHFSTSPEKYPMLRSGLHDALTAIVDDLAVIEPNMDFIAITGDLAEAGDIDSYLALRQLLGRLSIPVLVVPGNHDFREPFRQVFSAAHNTENAETLDYRLVFDGVQALGLDTLVEGEVGGQLTDRQLAWLQPLLADDGYSHTVICMHHPPFPIGQAEFDEIAALEGREKFGELVQQAGSDVIVLSGHVHRPYQAVWRGANCYIAGGAGFQIGSSFCFGNEALDVVDEPYAYFIHDIDRVAGHRVGTQYVELDRRGRGGGGQNVVHP